MNRDKIRDYIKRQLGKDPQDNFVIVSQTDKEITVRIKFEKNDDLTLTIPNNS